MPKKKTQDVLIELSAVIVSITDGEPQVMLLPGKALPSGPFGTQHRTLEQGLRAWVGEKSHLKLGYVEQLYTFADKDRMADGRRMVSIGYLALVRVPEAMTEGKVVLTPYYWYSFFPWEDRRHGIPQPVTNLIMQGLNEWKKTSPDKATAKARESRIEINFPKDPRAWNEELVLQRYELLWEAGLIEEAKRVRQTAKELIPGLSMPHDHRRILATGIARLRAKIKYRPVVFELMPPAFTLLQLQNTVEGLAGLKLHKQNFRRLVLSQGLVEETGNMTRDLRGRPAKLFMFRRQVLNERAAIGTKLPRSS